VNAAGGWPNAFQQRRESMKSNAKCWTPPTAAPLIAMLWLSACAMGGSDALTPCPPVVEYSVVDQAGAAAEVEALSEGAMVV
jgi:hypothetical protein